MFNDFLCCHLQIIAHHKFLYEFFFLKKKKEKEKEKKKRKRQKERNL
jgi:hypothetical protein